VHLVGFIIRKQVRKCLLEIPTNSVGFVNVVLLHSGHRYVSTTHVAFFEVVRMIIQICICVDITPQLTTLSFWLKFNLSRKTAMSKNVGSYKLSSGAWFCGIMFTEGTRDVF
jgi:hypothetical protein